MLTKLKEDLIKGMKERNQIKVNFLRNGIAVLNQESIAKKKDLTEAEEIQVLAGYIKKLKTSIADFERGGRKDIVDQYNQEIQLLSTYLPAAYTKEEIRTAVKNKIQQLTGADIKAMGRVIGELRKEMTAKMLDGQLLSEIVKSELTK